METWLADGQPDAIQRARQRWQELLANHEDPYLEATTKRQLQTYVAARSC
jgi:trimethylamine:corrinoid methyltransferase-like protein